MTCAHLGWLRCAVAVVAGRWGLGVTPSDAMIAATLAAALGGLRVGQA